MARRGGISEFLQAFNQGFDTVNKVGKDLEIAKLSSEKDAPVFTEAQGQELEAIANAKDQEGKPYYQLQAGADGNYSVVTNGEVDGAQPAPAAIAAGGTSYLGKTYDKPITDTQRSSAKQLAMAGIMDKYGDTEGGMRMRDSATRMQRDEKNDAQNDQRFKWDSARNERDIRQGDQAEADQKTLRDVDSKTADWFKSKLTNPDGTQRAATIDDHLAASQFRAGALTEAGRVGDSGKIMAEHNSQALIKIQLEGAQRDQELGKTAAALNAGDLGAVKDFYNKYVPDGAKVTNVTRDAKGQINIERESLDGRPMPVTVMKDTGQMVAALGSFKDPMALYQWSQNEFRNNLALRADSRAGAAEGRASANSDQAKTDAKERAAAGVALYKETNPNATPAQLEAVRTGILASVPKVDSNAPAEVKLAQAFINAGLEKDMASALRRASNSKNDSPEKFYQEVYKDALKSSYGDSVKAKAIADQAMKDRPDGAMAAAGAKPVGEFGSAADVEAAVKAGKVKPGDRVVVGGKTATWR